MPGAEHIIDFRRPSEACGFPGGKMPDGTALPTKKPWTGVHGKCLRSSDRA